MPTGRRAYVDTREWLLERQLDRQAATLLQQALQTRGLRFELSAQTAALLDDGQGRVRALRLADGRELPADLVVMAAGIRPATALAEAAGLRVERGIVVHDTLQSVTDPRVWAVGECAAHRGVTYGLVAPLYEQARVVANHLAGFGIAKYQGSVTSTKLKVTGIDLFSAGEFMGGGNTEEILLSDPMGGVWSSTYIRGLIRAGLDQHVRMAKPVERDLRHVWEHEVVTGAEDRFTWTLKLLGLLPPGLYFKAIRRATGL